jgi:predicted flap endonuclease-1-like 5' DNA nuclease
MAIPISGIRGMTAELAGKLKAQNIDNVDELLAAASKPAARRELARGLGVEPSLILDLVNRADLARIKGIGDAYANLLEEAGVDSVKELARRRPDNLHARLTAANEEKKYVTRLPTMEAVEGWIEQAKAMGQTVTE